jgi:DNA (cytosine-5)-methyltransferase 1
VKYLPRLLDLFCGAGGAAMGYHRAGFEVIGVDIKPQPHYPFTFVQMDWQEFLIRHGSGVSREPFGGPFYAIHASPPCQAYSEAQRIRGLEHPELVAEVRDELRAWGVPYVIENVPGAPLRDPVLLDGTMFPELRTKRPRLFETNWPLEAPFFRFSVPQPKMGRKPKEHEWIQVVGHFTDVKAARRAMGIDWMTRDELREAIPPAYTEYIGKQLLAQVVHVRDGDGSVGGWTQAL